MNRLHKSSYGDPTGFENGEGQRGLLCSNNESLSRCPSLGSNQTLSSDTFEALEGLGNVLKTIHKRMRAEGFTILNGKVVKVSDT